MDLKLRYFYLGLCIFEELLGLFGIELLLRCLIEGIIRLDCLLSIEIKLILLLLYCP